MDGEQAGLEAAFHPQRRKAALVLLSVTLVWGATFIWMKQALNALEVEIETYGIFSVVAYLVALRFLIATVLVAVVFPKARSGLRLPVIWKGGGVLGGLTRVTLVFVDKRQLSYRMGTLALRVPTDSSRINDKILGKPRDRGQKCCIEVMLGD